MLPLDSDAEGLEPIVCYVLQDTTLSDIKGQELFHHLIGFTIKAKQP